MTTNLIVWVTNYAESKLVIAPLTIQTNHNSSVVPTHDFAYNFFFMPIIQASKTAHTDMNADIHLISCDTLSINHPLVAKPALCDIPRAHISNAVVPTRYFNKINSLP